MLDIESNMEYVVFFVLFIFKLRTFLIKCFQFKNSIKKRWEEYPPIGTPMNKLKDLRIIEILLL